MATALKTLKVDKRGATTVQAILFIPVFLTIIFGGLTLWQVLSVKRSLHLATYEATRYLIFYPVNSTDPAIWQNVAGALIAREMRYSELPGSLDSVEVEGVEGGLICGTPITVTARWGVDINIPFVPPPRLVLQDSHEGRLCP